MTEATEARGDRLLQDPHSVRPYLACTWGSAFPSTLMTEVTEARGDRLVTDAPGAQLHSTSFLMPLLEVQREASRKFRENTRNLQVRFERWTYWKVVQGAGVCAKSRLSRTLRHC